MLSYTVAQRTREIGLRLASRGAGTGDVLRLDIRQGLRSASRRRDASGWIAAFGLKREFWPGSFHGVSATDPLTFALIPLLLIAVTLCWPATFLRDGLRGWIRWPRFGASEHVRVCKKIETRGREESLIPVPSHFSF